MSKFCEFCGGLIPDGQEICPECSHNINEKLPVENAEVKESETADEPINDTGIFDEEVDDSDYKITGGNSGRHAKKEGNPPNKPFIIAASLAAVFFVSTVVLFAMYVFPAFALTRQEPTSPSVSVTTAPVSTSPATLDSPTADEATTAPATVPFDETKSNAADFDDWFREDVLLSLVPEGATELVNSADIDGKWKMIIDYMDSTNVIRYCDLDMKITGTDVSEKLDSYTVKQSPEATVTADSTPSDELKGSFSNLEHALVQTKGNSGELVLTRFYELNGKQYATGYLSDTEGHRGYVGLTRVKQ